MNNNKKTDIEELRHENDLDADRDFIIGLGYVTRPPSIILTLLGLKAQDYTLIHKPTRTLNRLNENTRINQHLLCFHTVSIFVYLCLASVDTVKEG